MAGLAIENNKKAATVAAVALGHAFGLFRNNAESKVKGIPSITDNVCRLCGAAVHIDVNADPILSGDALSAPCSEEARAAFAASVPAKVAAAPRAPKTEPAPKLPKPDGNSEPRRKKSGGLPSEIDGDSYGAYTVPTTAIAGATFSGDLPVEVGQASAVNPPIAPKRGQGRKASGVATAETVPSADSVESKSATSDPNSSQNLATSSDESTMSDPSSKPTGKKQRSGSQPSPLADSTALTDEAVAELQATAIAEASAAGNPFKPEQRIVASGAPGTVLSVAGDQVTYALKGFNGEYTANYAKLKAAK